MSSTITLGTKNPYYEKFMGFFGGASNYPALKLWIHALDNLHLNYPRTTDMCQTFICDVTKFTTSEPLSRAVPTASLTGTPIANIPFDMAVFIHDIYTNLVVPGATVNLLASDDNSRNIKNAIMYVHKLHKEGVTTMDQDKAKSFFKIIQEHIQNATNESGVALPINSYNDLSSMITFQWKPITGINYTFGGVGGTSYHLSVLHAVMDRQKATTEYKAWLGRKRTNYNLTKYEANEIMLAAIKRNGKNVSNKASSDDFFKSKKISKSTQSYYRKESDPNKLFKQEKDAAGNTTEVEVQMGSDYYRSHILLKCNKLHKLTEGDGTADKPGVDPNDTTCGKFLTDCLSNASGTGLDNVQCRNYLARKEFWGEVKAEVFSDMLPDTACYILEKLGFKMKKVDKDGHKHLKVYEEVSEWLENINNETDKVIFTSIKDNTNLIAYLQMLLNLINGNPAILNTNYYKVSDPSSINRNRLIANGRFGKVGLVPFTGLGDKYIPVNMIQNAISENSSLWRQGLRLTQIVPVNFGSRSIFGMIGGNSSGKTLNEIIPSKQILKEADRSSARIKTLLENAMETLDKLGRSISEPDKARLYNYIEKLEDIENEVLVGADIIYEYMNILLQYDNDDGMNDKESIENINKWIESTGKRMDKLDKGSDHLLSVLKKFVDAIQLSQKK
jgi:hypothetical protein